MNVCLNIFLSFNEYINWPFGVSNYKIYFKNDTNLNWQLLDSTNSLNYSYIIQQGNMNYSFIVVAESDSLSISSLSNIVEFYANQPPIPQTSYISQVQVHSDTIFVKLPTAMEPKTINSYTKQKKWFIDTIKCFSGLIALLDPKKIPSQKGDALFFMSPSAVESFAMMNEFDCFKKDAY
mgnify:CR=1 FL=1